jgi:hypothetical protein
MRWVSLSVWVADARRPHKTQRERVSGAPATAPTDERHTEHGASSIAALPHSRTKTLYPRAPLNEARGPSGHPPPVLCPVRGEYMMVLICLVFLSLFVL